MRSEVNFFLHYVRHGIFQSKNLWWAFSKRHQRRQGLDLCPLWVLVGTPSAIKPELALRRAEQILPYSDVAVYIFDNNGENTWIFSELIFYSMLNEM